MRISDWSSDVCSSDLNQEATRFDAGQHIGLVLVHDLRQTLDGGLPGGRVGQQRRDVVEQDARRREVGDAADVVFQVHRRWRSNRLRGAWPGVGCRASYRPAGGRTMQGAAPEEWVTALRPPI